MKYLLRNKIMAQQHYIPIYKFKIYKSSAKDFLGSENIMKIL